MKYFNIFKKDNGGDEKKPTHSMSAKINEDDEKYTEIGACWTKEFSGGKFLSCKLNDNYVDHTKGTARKGFILIQEDLKGQAEDYAEGIQEDLF
jgi:uncharacterized protein (DUF736 family)